MNEDLAMELAKLADKYVQNELSEKCLDFLKFSINSDNVLKRLDFAFEQNLDQLKDFCKNFLKKNIEVKSLPDLIQYLEKLPEVKANVASFIVKKFNFVYKEYEKDWPFYEDFLIKNIGMSTISLLVNFVYCEHSEIIETSEMFSGKTWVYEEVKDQLLQNTLRLNQACFKFAKRNFKEIHQKGVSRDLPKRFLMNLALSAINVQ